MELNLGESCWIQNHWSDVVDPQKIGSLTNWTDVGAGEYHGCGIESGELYCWGSNWSWQGGNGDPNYDVMHEPEKIDTNTDWTQVSGGYEHSCGVRTNELYCWGGGYYDQVAPGPAGNSADYQGP